MAVTNFVPDIWSARILSNLSRMAVSGACVNRNYEGDITTYKEPDAYQSTFCERACADCKLQLATEAAEEYRAVGIERLLADYDQTISLVPAGNSRLSRRNGSAAPKRKAKGGAA